MTEFTVHLANRPGMLAALTELLADAGVTIEALAALGMDEEGIVRLIVDDAPRTTRALREAGLVAEQREVLTTWLDHKPRELAEMTRRLADGGVNIEALYLLKSTADGLEFAIAVDQVETARTQMTPA